MERNLYRVLLGTTLLGLLLAPTAAMGQEQARFRGLDTNGDGVISRNEWRGNSQSFRRLDRDGDGVISRDEYRETVGTSGTTGTLVPDLSFVDTDGNGEVNAQEWMRAFNQLDANRDGVLTEDELGTAAATTDEQSETVAFKSGRERGLSDGRQAGREDRARNVWDLDGRESSNGPMPGTGRTSVRSTSTRPATVKDFAGGTRRGTARAAEGGRREGGAQARSCAPRDNYLATTDAAFEGLEHPADALQALTV